MSKKISQLPQQSTPTTADKIPSVSGGDTSYSTVADLIALFFNNIPSGSSLASGWISSILPAVSSVAALGNRSYAITFASSVATYLTPGYRLRTSRTSAAPTLCTDLESGSSQYYNKTSPNKLTFTDDFVCSAWIKLESYTAGGVISRYNGTSGFSMTVSAAGQVQLSGFNASAANESKVLSYQGVTLGRWTHIAAQLDMSAFSATTTTSYVMMDGVDVPAAVSRAGTNPTALIQAGNLEVGSQNGGTAPFDGKLAQVAVYSAKVTQATILASIDRTLTGSETSLASAYSFNNSIADLNTTTPNDLTAQNSAVATNADSPFCLNANGVPGGTYDYAIVTKVATTVATVQVPEGCTIPTTGGVSAVDYSPYKLPFGMTVDAGRWMIQFLLLAQAATSGTTIDTTYNPAGLNLRVPIGQWQLIADLGVQVNANASALDLYTTLSTSSSAFITGSCLNVRFRTQFPVGTTVHIVPTYKEDYVSLSTATPYYILLRSTFAFTAMFVRGDVSAGVGESTTIKANLALL